MMNKKTLYFIYKYLSIVALMLVFSCDKKYSLIEEALFEEPYPANGTENVHLKNVLFGFRGISYTKINRIYIDTINPPNNQIDPRRGYMQVLLPNKVYYWYFAIKSYHEEVLSEIHSFRTVSFDGNWRLDSIKSSVHSIEVLPNSSEIDSILIPNYDLLEINIKKDSAQILFKSSDHYLTCNFFYAQTLDSISFNDKQNNVIYSYRLAWIGSFDSNSSVRLILVNSKRQTLLYSRY